MYPDAPPLLADLADNVIAFITSLAPLWGPLVAMMIGGSLVIGVVKKIWMVFFGAQTGVASPVGGDEDDDDDDDDSVTFVPDAYTYSQWKAKKDEEIWSPGFTQSVKGKPKA